MLKVEGHSNLVRDTHSKALINTDKNAYKAALLRRDRNIEKQKEILELKTEVKELKDMVQTLLNKLDK
jgi:hypothetical protein|tara:strand:+ start:169 stop:372 length:204 start_codon:yes stop_codon:yes gene_type:complete